MTLPTPAFTAKQDRDKEKAAHKGHPVGDTVVEAAEVEPPPASRQQPKRQTKSQRKQSGTRPGTPNQNKNKQQGGGR